MFNHIRNRADWNDKSSSDKGFTLIELLVVIAILGILAVVGVLSFTGLTDSAKNATSKTELTQVQTAAAAFAAKPANNGNGPASIAALVGDNDLAAGTTEASMECLYDFTASPVIAYAGTQTGHDNCKP